MQNLNFLFQKSTDSFAPALTKLIDGQVAIFRRPNSNKWYCRFKLPNGQWYVVSTGQLHHEEAKRQSVVIYAQVQVKASQGLAIHSRSFGRLAMEELESMEQKALNGKGKVTYADYAFAIKKYLIPFFSKYDINGINEDLISDFEAWRISEMGLVPKSSTKRNHASAFNRIVNRAVDKGYINNAAAVPKLDASGVRSEARPAFSQSEIDQLLEFMKDWELTGRMAIERLMRPLCRAYVEFLVNTGIRHGTEAIPLRWKNMQWHWIGDKRYLRIWVTGKTGPRYLIAKHAVIDTLNRLIKWQELDCVDLDGAIEAKLDKLVFCFPNRHTPHRMEGVFRVLMRDSGLAKDAAGKNRTLYSLRHTYATFALADEVDIHTLARQMGTSVGMIERHYSKLTPMLSAEKLA